MGFIDIFVLLLALFIGGGIIIYYIYKKRNKMTAGECSYCTLISEEMLKKIRRELKKCKKIEN